jgi:hypothetical protein
MRRPALALIALVVGLAGCNGGTVDHHALEKDAEAIDSLACEGALLADEIANTASTPQFSRVHAGELRTKASNFADALSERPTLPEIEREVRTLADKAGRIAGLLGELETHPSDTARSVRLRTALEQQGGCA